MFLINKPFARPNVSKTIRFTEQLDAQLAAIAKGEGISFNELVLRCCEYALKDYGGKVQFDKAEEQQGEQNND